MFNSSFRLHFIGIWLPAYLLDNIFISWKIIWYQEIEVCLKWLSTICCIYIKYHTASSTKRYNDGLVQDCSISKPSIYPSKTWHISVTQPLCNFSQRTTVIVPIQPLNLVLWMNEIMRYLSLRCVSDGCPTLHSQTGYNIKFICDYFQLSHFLVNTSQALLIFKICDRFNWVTQGHSILSWEKLGNSSVGNKLSGCVCGKNTRAIQTLAMFDRKIPVAISYIKGALLWHRASFTMRD